jgi:hypothetical protein
LIDGGDKIVVPVHVNAKSHDGIEVQVENFWIFEFVDGSVRRARVYAATAVIRDAVVSRGSSR